MDVVLHGKVIIVFLLFSTTVVCSVVVFKKIPNVCCSLRCDDNNDAGILYGFRFRVSVCVVDK